jgi:hypothetical protein
LNKKQQHTLQADKVQSEIAITMANLCAFTAAFKQARNLPLKRSILLTVRTRLLKY